VSWIDHKNGKCVVILNQYRKEDVEEIRKNLIHHYRIYNAEKIIDELRI